MALPNMETFKPTGAELALLQSEVLILEAANAALAKAKKQVEQAKENLCRWLSEKRGVSVESLGIGEMVLIEGAVILEIGKMDKLDEPGLRQKQPEIYAQFLKPIKVKKFKALH